MERFRGRADLDLDDIGIRQAEATAKRIDGWQLSVLYHSPLKRTTLTAQIIARKLNLEIKALPGIIDIDYGSWQGLSLAEAEKKDRKMFALWQEKPHLVKFPEGERLDDVRKRAASTVNDILKQHTGKNVVVVTHKVVCQILILHFLNMETARFWQIGQDVSAINLIEIKNNFSYARLINDTCHLKNAGLL